MKKIDVIFKNFKNPAILETAITHRSYLNENPKYSQSNERLEFLGDAVLELIISEALYVKFPKNEEGYLTALRSNLVNTTNLANVAGRIGLGSKLLLSKGELESGGLSNPSLLADSLEALIGAIYLDSGFLAVSKFINDEILIDLGNVLNSPLKDAKSVLQEIVQSQGYPAPKYEVLSETGPDHSKIFQMAVVIDNKPFAKGSGKSKGVAAQNAAASALAKMKKS